MHNDDTNEPQKSQNQ